MRVLIVDDDDIDLELLYATLTRAGYDVDVAKNGQQALEIVREGAHRLVISDWEMPEMSGVELCRSIRAYGFTHYIYIILVTARDGVADVVEGLDAGADDFITKPFEPSELCVRLRTGQRILALDSRDLMIFGLAKLAESRDPETGAHLERIREYCRVIAQDLSRQDKYSRQVDGEYVRTIYLTSPLHDIGKVGIPDNVLLNPGRLTDREWSIMKQHTIIGAETLRAVAREHPEVAFLHMAHEIALTHHEHFDGSGYPRGLSKEEIPLCGRLVALADVYDALTTRRIYKDAFSHDVARSIILKGSGVHFDPDIVGSFLRNEEEFIRIREQFTDTESPRSQEAILALATIG
jgi:putative two-component system response regulator